MNKTTHTLWLKHVDEEFRRLGAETFIFRAAQTSESTGLIIPEIPGYRFKTKYGPLEMHPDIPWRIMPGRSRLRYDCTVFGRFTAPPPYPADANQHSGKWNFHYGPREESELPVVLANLCYTVERMVRLSSE